MSAEPTSRRLSVLDRMLYALFSGHSDRRRHSHDRRHYRATTVTASFDVYLARVYGLSWVAFLLAAALAFGIGVALPAETVAVLAALPRRLLPAVELPAIPGSTAVAGLALLVGAVAKRGAVRLGGLYLRWRARARRSGIQRTLPGAVRYLHALAAGTDDDRDMLRKVADREAAYGETAVG